MIRGFSHFSFTVADVGRSTDWYTKLLGLKLLRRQIQDNAYTRQFVGVPDAVLDVAILGMADPSVPLALELVQYIRPERSAESSRAGSRSPNDVGFAHLSFVVEDITTEFERLAEAGVSFRSEPVAITEGINRGGLVCYFSDPDGNGLELFQPPGRGDYGQET